MLQYITSTSSTVPVAQQIKEVIQGGCKWVQIRMKNASDDEISQVVDEVKDLCKEHEVFLILNDRVELAKKLGVDGVHLGKEDMSASEARQILGAEAVIGVTVNTVNDIERLRYLDIDYFGVGPFRFTETKQNLSPIIGLDGYREIANHIRKEGIEIPTVAVGGITLEDVTDIMKTGINGIAVSGAIAKSSDIISTTRGFLSEFEQI